MILEDTIKKDNKKAVVNTSESLFSVSWALIDHLFKRGHFLARSCKDSFIALARQCGNSSQEAEDRWQALASSIVIQEAEENLTERMIRMGFSRKAHVDVFDYALVSAIEELGQRASGDDAKLEVVEVEAVKKKVVETGKSAASLFDRLRR